MNSLKRRLLPLKGGGLDKYWPRTLTAAPPPPEELQVLLYNRLKAQLKGLNGNGIGIECPSVEANGNWPLATRPSIPKGEKELKSWLSHWSFKLSKSVLLCDGPNTFSCKNSIQFYDNGDHCFEQILDRIQQAEKRVWLETYCLGENQSRLFAALKSASKRGVDVILAVDSIGSLGIPRALRELKATGAKIVYFNPWWRKTGPLVYRNHRKTLVADNTAFLGSMNFDDRGYRSGGEPISAAPWRERVFNWRRIQRRPVDLNHHAELRGPIVSAIASSLLRIAADTRIPLAPRSPDPVSRTRPEPPLKEGFNNVCIQLLESDGKKKTRSTIPKMILSCLGEASRSVVIASSYFHPPGFLRRALVSAVRRGVPTSLVLSGMSDVPFDSLATLSILPYFLAGPQNRARSFFIQRRHAHLKTFTADGLVSILGSYNWDRYSYRRNLEVAVAVVDARVTDAVNKSIDKQIAVENGSLRLGTAEYTLADARKVPILQRVRYLLAYRLVRATGGSIWDQFHPFKKDWLTVIESSSR